MTAQSRVVIEHAEKTHFDPLAIAAEHTPTAHMKVQVKEPSHVRNFVRARLARHEPSRDLRRVLFGPRAHHPVRLHVPGEGDARGHRPERRLHARLRAQIVMVKLIAPARVRPVLSRDRFAQMRADTRVRARASVHFALEHLHWIGRRVARRVQPMLDRRTPEAHPLPGRRVRVRPRRELIEL